jgi:hypothetical protein
MNAIKSAQPHRKRNGATGRNSQRKRQRNNRQEKPPAPKPACCVCSVNDTPPQYKCPRCKAQYCSVACCKKHKETCSQEKKPQEGKVENPSKYANQLPFPLTSNQPFSRQGDLEDDEDDDDSMDEEWKINEEMKSTLSRSEWLRNELKDGGLKDLIAQIVSAGNRKDLVLLQVKERYPSFKTFLDKLLLVAGVLERQNFGDEQEEPFEKLLERDWDENRPTLALKSRDERVLPVFEPIQHSSSSSEGSDESDSSSSSEDEDSKSASSSSSDD